MFETNDEFTELLSYLERTMVLSNCVVGRSKESKFIKEQQSFS